VWAAMRICPPAVTKLTGLVLAESDQIRRSPVRRLPPDAERIDPRGLEGLSATGMFSCVADTCVNALGTVGL
jgi:hypothetical protein